MAAVSMMAYPVRDGFHGYPQHYAMYQTRPQQPHVEVGHPVHVHPYAYSAVPPQHSYHHQPHPQPQPQPQLPTHRSPQPTSSPLSEDGFKPSLPSISNLLGLADRPATDNAQSNPTVTSQPRDQLPSPQPTQQPEIDPRQQPPTYPVAELSTSPRSVVPPPPPMRNDSVLEGTNSPSTISSGSTVSGPPYFVGSAINNIDPSDQRTAQLQAMKRPSVPSQPNLSPYGQSRYTASPYATSPASISAPSYYSPPHTSYPAGLYQQRPLPSNFPPPPPAIPVQSNSLPTSNPWEHHHYISPSSQATFPQSQDRYICPTCNKAFSRPSSLKIHSHSHTGEKPFRCPHAGCGKAFSVRSNMKRHERGCHSAVGGHIPPHAHMI